LPFEAFFALFLLFFPFAPFRTLFFPFHALPPLKPSDVFHGKGPVSLIMALEQLRSEAFGRAGPDVLDGFGGFDGFDFMAPQG
jgi:hypothetical protein